MLFNSLHFFVFFPAVLLLYFLLKKEYRWILLLISSYYFYMSWKAEYAILLALSTIFNYYTGLWIHRSESLQQKRSLLSLCLFGNLLVLFFFKYVNFFSEAASDVLKMFSIPFSPLELQILLPLGISFFTFQVISYNIDIYRNQIPAEKHLGYFALYKSFFPILVAGPIERAKNLIPQLHENHAPDYIRMKNGLLLMAWGFFKKMVIADRLAVVVDSIYSSPTHFSGLPLIIGTVFFAYQIYCDFSGYTDIATGAALMMGIRLTPNFKRPYSSASVAEFWTRWHISLSSWFQDYLFNPLYLKFSKMKKLSVFESKTKHIISFTLTLLIGETLLGLWHGANWTFVVFGFYYGVAISLYYLLRRHYDGLNLYLRIALTFIFINIGWVFFRATTISDAFYVLTHLLQDLHFDLTTLDIGISAIYLGILFFSIILLEFIQFRQGERSIGEFLESFPLPLRWGLYFLLIWSILLFGMFNEVQFIYFQF